MSRENVEIVVGVFENTNARSFTAVMDAYADDIVLVIHGEAGRVGGEGAVGKDAVGQWFGDWFRTFDPDYRFEIEEARDCGDQVLIVATHNARGKASGVPVTMRAAWVHTLRDGKVIRCDAYTDRGEALKAAGLSE